MEKIYHHFIIKAPVAKVFESITSIEGLRNWWTTDTTGSTEKNGELRFGFGGPEMFNKMKVAGMEKNKSLQWKCIDGPKEWIGAELSFRLSTDKDGNTVVRFTHDGWKTINDFFGSCNYHWGLFMKSLKSLCESGKGTPHGV
jgi:uncharacterized protein YndB with AHSA1/START domain